MSMFYDCVLHRPFPGYDENFLIRYPESRKIMLSGCNGAGHSRWDKGHQTCYSLSTNKMYSLELITSGKFRLTTEGRSTILHPGDLFFLRYRQGDFFLKALSESRKKVLLIDQFSISIHLLSILFGKESVLCGTPGQKIEEYFDKVIEAVFDPDKNYEIDQHLFSLFCTINQEKRYRLPEPVKKVLALIEQLPGSAVSRSVLVREAGVSISTLNRLFQQYFQCSPCEYCKKMRMEQATQLLRHTSVKETAAACGYSSVSFFCKDFKKRFKMTPRQFNNNLD